ncbi:MAG: translation initiation factor IF-3 [Chlamydiia bacterium]|nr:translation initiation factor IF-3 [Chlamydiia bacterium]
MNFRINRQIRALKVRLIGPEGNQVGIVSIKEALAVADEAKLDLVEISPNAEPPVCKVIDYGKFRYDQTKREKESKKAQHQVKVKEIKVKPNIDEHDFLTKLKKARSFLEKGNKVKVACFFRGREMAFTELGEKVVLRMVEELGEVGGVESPPKMMGRSMIVVLAPLSMKKGR